MWTPFSAKPNQGYLGKCDSGSGAGTVWDGPGTARSRDAIKDQRGGVERSQERRPPLEGEVMGASIGYAPADPTKGTYTCESIIILSKLTAQPRETLENQHITLQSEKGERIKPLSCLSHKNSSSE